MNEGIPNNYDKFDFVNAQVGWLTERNRFNSYRIYGLIKTEDGGENWKLIQLPGDIYFSMIDFTSDYIGWAFGNSETDDGGDNWSVQVDLSIYNILGEKVTNLVAEKQKTGYHRVEWDASGFASGVYLYRLSAKGKSQSFVKTRKLVLLK